MTLETEVAECPECGLTIMRSETERSIWWHCGCKLRHIGKRAVAKLLRQPSPDDRLGATEDS